MNNTVWVDGEMHIYLIRAASFNCISFECPQSLIFASSMWDMLVLPLAVISSVKSLQPLTVFTVEGRAWTLRPFPSLSLLTSRIVNRAADHEFQPRFITCSWLWRSEGYCSDTWPGKTVVLLVPGGVRKKIVEQLNSFEKIEIIIWFKNIYLHSRLNHMACCFPCPFVLQLFITSGAM